MRAGMQACMHTKHAYVHACCMHAHVHACFLMHAYVHARFLMHAYVHARIHTCVKVSALADGTPLMSIGGCGQINTIVAHRGELMK